MKEINKEYLRKVFLEKRKALTVKECETLSISICQKILESNWYKDATDILAYMSIQKEVDTSLLVKQCLADGKLLYLPKVLKKEMHFYKVDALEDLKAGTFGILEPKATIPFNGTKGLMVVPGVSFSKEGFRIGYGGGYYDRYLAKEHAFTTIGVCYEQQISPYICPESFDQPLDYIVTEKEIY